MTREVISALRGIARYPVLAAVVIVSLGAGIGVNTVVFSWLQARVLHPLPEVRDANGFLLVEPRTETGLNPGASWLEYRDLQERLGSFPELFAFRMVPLYLGEPGRVERAYGQFVSGNYFTALGLRPALGRFLRPDEVARPRTEPVAVISYPLWQKRFAGAPNAVGQSMRVNGNELTIVGVAPRRFQGTVLGLSFDMWVPATLAPVLLEGSLELQSRTVRGYSVMGRLNSTTAQAQAQAELDSVMAQLALTYPESNAKVRGEVLTFWESPRGPQRLLAAALAALQGIMVLLLLAVCGNTANLVLARASARQREVGIRLALGATPWRVARLMLLESVVLAFFGAGVGVAIAIWGTPGLIALPLSGLPIRFETDVNSAGIVFAVALGIACGLLSGAAPAFQVARLDPQVAFRAGQRSSGRSRVRDTLMAVQVALALIVLIIDGPCASS
jgi:predicted permease